MSPCNAAARAPPASAARSSIISLADHFICDRHPRHNSAPPYLRSHRPTQSPSALALTRLRRHPERSEGPLFCFCPCPCFPCPCPCFCPCLSFCHSLWESAVYSRPIAVAPPPPRSDPTRFRRPSAATIKPDAAPTLHARKLRQAHRPAHRRRPRRTRHPHHRRPPLPPPLPLRRPPPPQAPLALQSRRHGLPPRRSPRHRPPPHPLRPHLRNDRRHHPSRRSHHHQIGCPIFADSFIVG